MNISSPKPSLFETIAGVSKFIAVEHITPAFFRKHEHPIQFSCAFLRIVANKYPALEKAFRKGLPLPVRESAKAIEEALTHIDFAPSEAHWFDAQSTEVLKVLLPVVRDPELPSWISESRWAIEGAFEPN